MENETFKVAKDILEKYAPHQLQSMTSQNFVSTSAFIYYLIFITYIGNRFGFRLTKKHCHLPLISNYSLLPIDK